MKTDVHDIRLAAGFEIPIHSAQGRTLNREQAERLAEALAADLARTVPNVDQAMLVMAGSLFEPAQLLRPGLPAWTALSDLAAPVLREQGLAPRLLAIGSHGDRLPDRRLAPPEEPVQGQFLAVPLLLVSDLENGPALETALERDLFERGSIDPPARALLHQAVGLDSVHGQLLTATDLLALQHVQMDAAGLSGFWPVIEHAILAPDESAEFELATGLKARWNAADQLLAIDFVPFDAFGGTKRAYLLWLRALRTLTALADAHGLGWAPICEHRCEIDDGGRLVRHWAGPCAWTDGLTEHSDPEAGLIAWSVVLDGQLSHLYPLDAATARQQRELLHQRYKNLVQPGQMLVCPDTCTLTPAIADT
ncbi:MAG: hypothetical protein V2J42_12725 [Wenzhouxiangella sp.]|nr:hypothetical protein [Wenzhouxiangella sp.]